MNIKIFIAAAGLVGAVAGLACITETNAKVANAGTASANITNKGRKPTALHVPGQTFDDREFDGELLTRTDAEWRKQLTSAEYNILRKQGTEAPYSHDFAANHKKGVYYCRACGLALFRSANKFESGTGWPSFYKPIFEKNVVEVTDTSLSETRTEIECARCHSHLGHVFNDGPEPTGLRYCMNGLALQFRKSASTGPK